MRRLLLGGLLVLAGVGLSLAWVGGDALDPHQAEGSEGGVVEVEQEEPFDVEGPWTVSAVRLRVDPGVGEGLEVVTPGSVRAGEGPVDDVVVVDPDGRVLVIISCGDGSCLVKTPVGSQRVPSGTVSFEGAWEQGRASGFTLNGAMGEALVRVGATGEGGVVVEGEALGEEVSVALPLVVEGDPRSPERVALVGGSGEALLVFETGGGMVGSVTVGDRSYRVDEVHASVHGDVFSDEEVLVRVWVDGERYGFVVKRTPAEAFGALGEALEDHVVVHSPVREVEASYRFQAGPASFVGEGVASSRFDAVVSVGVEEGKGFREGWLRVDGEPVERLSIVGASEGESVLQARIAGEALGPGVVEVGARLERVLAPGVVQVQDVDPVTVRFVEEGPSPPSLVATEAGLSWDPVEGVAWWEALARPVGEEAFSPVKVDEATLVAPFSPPTEWEGKVRGVDALGNPGPWSNVTRFNATEETRPEPGAPSLVLTGPEPGERLGGVVVIEWEPSSAIAVVEAGVRLEGSSGFDPVGSSVSGSLAWDTRGVVDGEHELRVTARGPGGASSVVVPVIVENLDPVTSQASMFERALESKEDQQGASGGGVGAWMPGRPLPAALFVAFGLAKVTFVGAALWSRFQDKKA